MSEVNIFCPFHKNLHSPAFYINIKTGLWQCFNQKKKKKGNFRHLYKQVTGKPFGKDIKLDHVALQNHIDRELNYEEAEEQQLNISDVEIDYTNDEDLEKLLTLYERGLEYNILEHFEVGYSAAKERVVIPVRDAQYKAVGFIGRAIRSEQDPRYLYNKGFKRANVLFNIQNAKQYNSCIVVEGSIDAMFIHQAGFPNVVATLGSKVSDFQFKLLKKYFDSIIVFSDNDEAGEYMKRDILFACSGKDLYTVQLPADKKDAGEMTQEEIINTLTNKQSHI
jgi:5S rRNA maturation endonuclease (ribonuclease M5)